jgi:predicted exporter
VRGARAAIAVWLVFVVTCAWIAAHAHYNADMSAFLPRAPTPSQQILVDQLREGVVSRVLLVGVEGVEPEVLAQISNALAERLSHAPEISDVNNGSPSMASSCSGIVTC